MTYIDTFLEKQPKPTGLDLRQATSDPEHGLYRADGRRRPDCRGGCDAGFNRSGSRGPVAGVMAVDDFLYRLLRGLDDFRHHRDSDQAGTGSERHAVRPAGRHADPDRVAHPPAARHLVGSVWRAHRVHAHHAVGRRDDGAAGLRLRLSHLPSRRARRRHRGRILLSWRRLCRQVVPEGEAGNGSGHLRRRQCRRGCNQVRRAGHHGRLWLDHRGAGLGGRARDHGRGLLHDDEGRSRSRAPPRVGPEA
jgi:hypothetical protein